MVEEWNKTPSIKQIRAWNLMKGYLREEAEWLDLDKNSNKF